MKKLILLSLILLTACNNNSKDPKGEVLDYYKETKNDSTYTYEKICIESKVWEVPKMRYNKVVKVDTLYECTKFKYVLVKSEKYRSDDDGMTITTSPGGVPIGSGLYIQ